MVKLIIRDDDLNFFTKVEDIEYVYRRIPTFPVSFAVIPMVVDVSMEGKCSDTCGNTTPRWIGDNLELTAWLKDKLEKGRIDVLMHGITHEYKLEDGKRKAEMEWRKETDLMEKINDLKNRLGRLLEYPISVFVAPSNHISKYAINCISDCELDYSGIVPLNFQRNLTLRNVYCYIKRTLVRTFNKIPYPGVLRYSNHYEINACNNLNFEYLRKLFDYCNKRNLPMAINVHYWHIRDNYEHYKDFFSFVDYAIENGAQPAKLSEVVKQYKNL